MRSTLAAAEQQCRGVQHKHVLHKSSQEDLQDVVCCAMPQAAENMTCGGCGSLPVPCNMTKQNPHVLSVTCNRQACGPRDGNCHSSSGFATLTATVAPFHDPLKTRPEPPWPSRGPRATAAKASASTCMPGIGGRGGGTGSPLLGSQQLLPRRTEPDWMLSRMVAK